MTRHELTDIEVAIHHETERAILVSLDGDEDNAIWLPKCKRTMETAVFSGGPNSEKEEEPFSIAFSSALRVAQGQH